MNRRLFVRQAVASVSLLSIPSSLLARSVASPQVASSWRNVAAWLQNGALGTLQHATLSCVYSPERTSLSALKALAQANLADLNALLQTDFTLAEQAWNEFSAAEHGSFCTELNQNGVALTWQGLARIDSPISEPVVRLQLWGSQGIVQCPPGTTNYQYIDLQTQQIPTRAA